jgi:hypothetical protein
VARATAGKRTGIWGKCGCFLRATTPSIFNGQTVAVDGGVRLAMLDLLLRGDLEAQEEGMDGVLLRGLLDWGRSPLTGNRDCGI